jgi:hypothetical protein
MLAGDMSVDQLLLFSEISSSNVSDQAADEELVASPSEDGPHGARPRRKVKPTSGLAGHVWAVEAL